MSNTDLVIAICRDDVYSAESFDGSTWQLRELDTSHAWKFIGGSIGNFIYDEQNLATKHTQVAYSITDYVHWRGGVLPCTIANTIVATFDTSNVLYTSYDGNTFTAPNQTFYVECSAVVCTDDPGTAFSQSSHFTPMTFPITCSAIAWSYGIVGAWTRIKHLVAMATPVSGTGSGYISNGNAAPGTGVIC